MVFLYIDLFPCSAAIYHCICALSDMSDMRILIKSFRSRMTDAVFFRPVHGAPFGNGISQVEQN
jgi:hypothetical protein